MQGLVRLLDWVAREGITSTSSQNFEEAPQSPHFRAAYLLLQAAIRFAASFAGSVSVIGHTGRAGGSSEGTECRDFVIARVCGSSFSTMEGQQGLDPRPFQLSSTLWFGQPECACSDMGTYVMSIACFEVR